MKDEDGDDWGDEMPPAGVTPGSDCDDGSVFAFPGAAEIEAPDKCMEDEDDDGWGDAAPDGPNTDPGTDCADQNASAFPGAAPNDDPLACMEDEDGDDWGDAEPPDGVDPGTDCADDDPQVFVDCEPCDPMSKMCVDQELWTCNDNGNAYVKDLCEFGCDPVQLICVDELTLEAGPSVCIDPGDMAQLDAIVMGGDGNYQWNWTPPQGLSDPMIPNPVASPMAQANYTVTVMDGLNNMAQDNLSVFIKDTPLPLSDVECAVTGFGWGGGGVGNWAWDPNNAELCQTQNSPPTARFCGWSLDNAELEGLFQVKTGADNDYVGFLFGLQPFDVGNEDPKQFYFFSWKQGDQFGFCPGAPQSGRGGMLIKRIDVADPMNTPLSCADMHDPNDTANSKVLATEDEMTTQGWADNTEYIFDLVHEPDQFTVRILNAGNMQVVAEKIFADNTYPNGGVGFYAYSQQSACYRQFTTTCQ
jgi:hypothetical protein